MRYLLGSCHFPWLKFPKMGCLTLPQLTGRPVVTGNLFLDIAERTAVISSLVKQLHLKAGERTESYPTRMGDELRLSTLSQRAPMLMELEARPNEVSLTLLSSTMEKVEKTKMRTLELPESDEHLPLLQFGEFTLDRQQLALYRGQQTVHLTGKAFRTLVLLVVNRGKTLSRDALLDSVWADVCVTPNTVDHAVAEIRHALNDHQEPTRFIRTIPREGYCFIAEVREMMLQPSLAILPFSTLGLESSGERVSVGLADALITRLCNLNNSLVCPTAAVLRYAGNARDPLKAGRELGADFVLEGLIQKAGEPVRITLQLIRVCDGKPLWAETFDETFTSIFALEDAFVQKVTQALPSPFGIREGRKADASGIGRSEL